LPPALGQITQVEWHAQKNHEMDPMRTSRKCGEGHVALRQLSGLGSAASASHTQVSICMQMGSEHAMDLIGFISDTSESAD
jgi:hypothetical protein